MPRWHAGASETTDILGRVLLCPWRISVQTSCVAECRRLCKAVSRLREWINAYCCELKEMLWCVQCSQVFGEAHPMCVCDPWVLGPWRRCMCADVCKHEMGRTESIMSIRTITQWVFTTILVMINMVGTNKGPKSDSLCVCRMKKLFITNKPRKLQEDIEEKHWEMHWNCASVEWNTPMLHGGS